MLFGVDSRVPSLRLFEVRQEAIIAPALVFDNFSPIVKVGFRAAPPSACYSVSTMTKARGRGYSGYYTYSR